MKNILKYTLLLAIVTMVSCKKESLQSYIVEKQDDNKYTTFSLSKGLLPIKMKANASDDEKKAFESVRKVNIILLESGKADEPQLKAEQARIKSILKKDAYKTLLKLQDKRGKATLYYTGETDAIDEIIAAFNIKKVGVGIARVLGDEMNPAAIMSMMKNVEANTDSEQMEGLKNLLKSQVKDSVAQE